MFDFTDPGVTSVVWMLKGRSSIESVSVMEWRAALDAQYIPLKGVGLIVALKRDTRWEDGYTHNSLEIDPTTTICPVFRLAI